MPEDAHEQVLFFQFGSISIPCDSAGVHTVISSPLIPILGIFCIRDDFNGCMGMSDAGDEATKVKPPRDDLRVGRWGRADW